MPNHWLLACLPSLLLIGACSHTPSIGGYPVISHHQAQGQSSRARHIVLHYTSSPTAEALHTLTQGQVSSHYLISDSQPPKLYQLVDESRRAWHAGISHWYKHSDLNTSSIGIEIVNPGHDETGQWVPYHSEQIDVLIALLQDLVERHQISASNIVGHSDIAPQRKIDPGPLFPWQQLAQVGLGRWFDSHKAQYYSAHYEIVGLPDTRSIQQQLQAIGYLITTDGVWNQASTNVLRAFQMHYRPSQHNGELDAETAGILRALQPPTPQSLQP